MGAGGRAQSSSRFWEVMSGRVGGRIRSYYIKERCVHGDQHARCGVFLLYRRAEAVASLCGVYLDLNKAFYMDR